MTRHLWVESSHDCVCVCECCACFERGSGTNAHRIIIHLKRLGIIMTNNCRESFKWCQSLVNRRKWQHKSRERERGGGGRQKGRLRVPKLQAIERMRSISRQLTEVNWKVNKRGQLAKMAESVLVGTGQQQVRCLSHSFRQMPQHGL